MEHSISPHDFCKLRPTAEAVAPGAPSTRLTTISGNMIVKFFAYRCYFVLPGSSLKTKRKKKNIKHAIIKSLLFATRSNKYTKTVLQFTCNCDISCTKKILNLAMPTYRGGREGRAYLEVAFRYILSGG